MSRNGIGFVFNSGSTVTPVCFCAPFHQLVISMALLLRTTCLVNETISLALKQWQLISFAPVEISMLTFIPFPYFSQFLCCSLSNTHLFFSSVLLLCTVWYKYVFLSLYLEQLLIWVFCIHCFGFSSLFFFEAGNNIYAQHSKGFKASCLNIAFQALWSISSTQQF